MKEIKTVALIGLGAIGSFLASHLKYALEYNSLRIIAGGERKKKAGKKRYYRKWRTSVFSCGIP